MKEEGNKKKKPGLKAGKEEKDGLQGYPLYPSNEDIYNRYQEEKNINPEDVSRMKEANEDDIAGKSNEKDFNEDISGGDLDVPGSELDDNREDVGNEDEENNYYSLGGDDHNDLDEDKGELSG